MIERSRHTPGGPTERARELTAESGRRTAKIQTAELRKIKGTEPDRPQEADVARAVAFRDD
ncbi:MAG: hypothetical protein ACRDSZ_05200 [Pseudonocardiaceae bacterium]